MKQLNKRQVGSRYETIAAAYLTAHGYTILERNVFTPYGELDIIACQNNIICYVECKYRSSNKYGDPLEAVDKRKQRRICKAAIYHYVKHGAKEKKQCRFDVIGIYADGTIKHIENAFNYQK